MFGILTLPAGRAGVRILAQATDFDFLQIVQTGCGLHTASCSVGMGVSFRSVKPTGREAEHALPSSAEMNSQWSYTSVPTFCLRGMDIITLTRNATCTLLAHKITRIS